MRKLIITLIGFLLVVIGAVATRQYDMITMQPVTIITLADIKTDAARKIAQEHGIGTTTLWANCVQKADGPDEAANIKTVAQQFNNAQ